MIITLLLLSLLSARAQITDSLVKNLSCEQLTQENVLNFIDRSKLTADLHIPFRNWGANLIGQCWALSSAQRKLYYMQRLGVSGSQPPKKEFHYAIDVFRGFKRQNCSGDLAGAFGTSGNCTDGAVRLRVIEMPEEDFPSSRAYQSWFETNAKPFKQAIEESQQSRFYNFGAIGLATASTVPTKSESQKTLRAIQKSLARGGMPMVVLRIATMTQHVVLIKEQIEEAGQIKFRLYDSNYPYDDMVMMFNGGYFYAPDSVGLFDATRANRPIDIALVDESEMSDIRSSLFQYYRKKCQTKN